MSGKSIGAIVAAAVIAVGAYFGYQYYQQQEAHKQADAFLDKAVTKYGVSAYKSASVSADGSVTIKDLTVTPKGATEPYQVDELVVHRFDYANEKPNFMHIEAKGLHMDVSRIPNPGAQLFLGIMGYKALNADMELNYDFKPEAKTVTLALRETIKDLGEIKLNADLGNVTRDATPPAMQNMEIHSAQVSYHDDSFLDRVLKMAAAQQGVSEDEVVKRMEQQLDARLGQSKTKLQTEVISHVKEFLSKRGTLTIAVSPAQPVPVSELRGMTPDAAFDRLNVKVTND